jgi:hypothetical protein
MPQGGRMRDGDVAQFVTVGIDLEVLAVSVDPMHEIPDEIRTAWHGGRDDADMSRQPRG